jgi:ComF family protein
MHHLIDACLDLLFPPRCCSCGVRGVLLCNTCRDTCRLVPTHSNDEQHRRLGSPFLASTAGAYIFEGAVREAVHTLKYNRKVRTAHALGDLLLDYLKARPLEVDAIVAVPLHAKREQARGFNQSLLLAKRLSTQTQLPLLETSLVRVRSTSQQADLTRAQRRENVRDAFIWQSHTPPPPRILLLDDVLTTGAT